MRILFLTHYFPPEVNAPAARTHEHCREWAAAGHDVHVLTCVPSHPAGRPFPGYKRTWYSYERLDGIHVHRVWTYLAANRGTVRRTLNFLSFVPTATLRAIRLGTFDVVVATSPQFFCPVAAWLAARIRGWPWVFELRDLWPDSLAAVGVAHPSLLVGMLQRLELRMYRDAAAVVCVTRSFVDNLARRGIPPEKVSLIPNGIVPSFWAAADGGQERSSAGVQPDDVVVSYVGTIGLAHGLRSVLDAAARLQLAMPRVKFWIVGDGAERESLERVVRAQGLLNVRFTGLLPRDRIPSVLAATDISLVTLRPSDVFKTVLPSKMFESMAARRPVVLAVDGEARAVLEQSGAGIAVPPGDVDALVAAITALASDPQRRRQLGAAGAAFVERHFSRRQWALKYLELLEALTRRSSALPATVSLTGNT